MWLELSHVAHFPFVDDGVISHSWLCLCFLWRQARDKKKTKWVMNLIEKYSSEFTCSWNPAAFFTRHQLHCSQLIFILWSVISSLNESHCELDSWLLHQASHVICIPLCDYIHVCIILLCICMCNYVYACMYSRLWGMTSVYLFICAHTGPLMQSLRQCLQKVSILLSFWDI